MQHLPTLLAKKNPDKSTPTRTPIARSCVKTTTTTVEIMTTLAASGCSRRLRIEAQLKVPIETMIITATSAAIGIIATRSPAKTTITIRKTPAANVESRPRPPDLMLMTA